MKFCLTVGFPHVLSVLPWLREFLSSLVLLFTPRLPHDKEASLLAPLPFMGMSSIVFLTFFGPPAPQRKTPPPAAQHHHACETSSCSISLVVEDPYSYFMVIAPCMTSRFYDPYWCPVCSSWMSLSAVESHLRGPLAVFVAVCSHSDAVGRE